jgi:peptidoglycan/LPS O-acetylase OafA/YrhL
MPTKFFCDIESLVATPWERVPGFLGRVESLRGLAALMVAICHSQLVFVVDGHEDLWRLNISHVQGLQAFATKMLLIVFNGGAAVSLFFVISGLVLGLSLDRQKDEILRSSVSFLLRRALRIYPALILSLLLVQAWLPLIYPAPDYVGASLMFQPLYRVPQAADFFANLFFVSNQMNPVIWTLKIEMEVALVGLGDEDVSSRPRDLLREQPGRVLCRAPSALWNRICRRHSLC